MAERVEPVRCICGNRPVLFTEGGLTTHWVVHCNRSGCWAGPFRRTKRGAALAWNRVMGAAVSVGASSK